MVKYKVKSSFKQMAFETAIRNPERYKNILKILSKYENVILNNTNILEIVYDLYLNRIVSSKYIEIKKEKSKNNIIAKIITVNISRRADGGFPSGYCSRFWTYVRTLCEFGFVYAEYNDKLKLSKLSKLLVNEKIDEHEAFSIQAMNYNRKSPYRNVANDFNYFKFILKVLLKVKELSYSQFIVSMFSKDGDVNDFIKNLHNYDYKNYDQLYKYLQKTYDIRTKFKTVTADYPDVLRRILVICGFISFRYEFKKYIQINENKKNYIKELLRIDNNLCNNISNPLNYYNCVNKKNNIYLKIAYKYRKIDVINPNKYTNTVYKLIQKFKIDINLLIECFNKIESKNFPIAEFKDIPPSLKLEFFISILIILIYGIKYKIKPNYKADHLGKPYSHAPGEIGDIEVYYEDFYWLIEVTLLKNKLQQYNSETTSLIRHLLKSNLLLSYSNKYLSFVAPIVHDDTKRFFKYSVVMESDSKLKLYIKPYKIDEFLEHTISKNNFKDMEIYTKNIFIEFTKKMKLENSY